MRDFARRKHKESVCGCHGDHDNVGVGMWRCHHDHGEEDMLCRLPLMCSLEVGRNPLCGMGSQGKHCWRVQGLIGRAPSGREEDEEEEEGQEVVSGLHQVLPGSLK